MTWHSDMKKTAVIAVCGAYITLFSVMLDMAAYELVSMLPFVKSKRGLALYLFGKLFSVCLEYSLSRRSACTMSE